LDLEQAYGGRPLDNLSISRVLLSHNHAVAELFPSAFLSQCKYEAEQRGVWQVQVGQEEEVDA
jgi:hypothetical protein